MKKILEKWYVSMFFVPILLTYLTNYIKLPDVFTNWRHSIIASLIILTGILIYELTALKKKYFELIKEPIESDKRIIRELLKTLNLDDFHRNIVQQDAWHGYEKKAIGNIIDFIENATLIKNKIYDSKLNELLNHFIVKIKLFQNYSSIRLYDGGNFYIPNKKDQKTKEISKIESKKMNEITRCCFKKLEILMEYLRKRKYL